jgi:hypothetical protein
MFEPTERIVAMVDELYALTVPLERGDILPHEDISRVLECEPHTQHYQWALEGLKRRLRKERHIAIWNVREIGYRLLSKEDQLHVPIRRFRRAIRQVRKGRRDIECLPPENLTLHQQVVLGHRLEQSYEAERDLRRKVRDQARVGQRPEVNPRVAR